VVLAEWIGEKARLRRSLAVLLLDTAEEHIKHAFGGRLMRCQHGGTGN
jgi:hypothetical protein